MTHREAAADGTATRQRERVYLGGFGFADLLRASRIEERTEGAVARADALFRTDWVVYAKPAFGGATAVLRYLGRYTHRVAISNHRLIAFGLGSRKMTYGRRY